MQQSHAQKQQFHHHHHHHHNHHHHSSSIQTSSSSSVSDSIDSQSDCQSSIDCPVDLSKLNTVEQQRSVIFPPSSSSSTSTSTTNINKVDTNSLDTNHHQYQSATTPIVMDLSVANVNNNNGESQQQSSTTPTAALESHSRHIKKVLKHYQAAATLSLNGPDWFLPIVSSFSATTTNGNSSMTASTSSPSLRVIEASSSSSSSSVDNGALELTKTSNSTLNVDNKVGTGNVSTTLDLRTTTNSSTTMTTTNKQTISPYLSTIGQSTCKALSTNRSSSSSSSMKDLFDPLLAPPPFPIQQPPLLTPPDQGPSRSERSETRLEGEFIACFMVGGERRLCVPQIFNIVLRDFSLQQINQVIEELQINCSTCTRDQMEVLKLSGDIPPMAPSCGLITKTDAHRLCSTLLGSATSGSGPGGGNNNISSGKAGLDFHNTPYILVYHECFGRCVGRYAPSLYTHQSAQCIQCDECMASFAPYAFVCHSHKPRENRTVHWGFDPTNWRSYLLPIEDLASYETSPLMAISNNLSMLLADSKNLSHLLLLVQSSKSTSSSSSSSSLIPPCCTGGRKSLKSSQSSMTAVIDALYQSIGGGKNIDNIRSIMKEMKCRFSKQTISSSSTSKLNSSSSRLMQPLIQSGNNHTKRKDMFDTPILSSSSSKSSSLLMSLESTLNQHQQQTSNKRIKSEPLDLHHPSYSNCIQVGAANAAAAAAAAAAEGVGGSNCQSTNNLQTMSPFVYPFLQSYLTSGMMPPPPQSLTQKQLPSTSCSNDEKQQLGQKEFLMQQKQPTTNTTTNYLSALLNGAAAAAAAAAAASGNSSSSSSSITNNSSNALIANILNTKSSDSSDSLSSMQNKLQSKALSSSLFTANNNNNANHFCQSNPLVTMMINGANNAGRLYNSFYGSSNVDYSSIVNQSSRMASSQPPQQQQTTASSSSNSHPIDRLLGDSLLLVNQRKGELLDINPLKSESQRCSTSQSPKETLTDTLIGDNVRTSLSSSSSLLSAPKNLNSSSHQLYESTAIKSSTNQKDNDVDNTSQQSHGDLSWPFVAGTSVTHQNMQSSAANNHLKWNQCANKNLAALISPNTLMEGNLYNTIHMLQKMRHLCFELENAQLEVETRIQLLGQLIKDSSFDALKRNLSMIEYLIDDILVHFINNNHQLPSTGSLIMERFKKQMFTNILDMLEGIFADKLSNITNQNAEQQLSSHLKMEKIDNETVTVAKKTMSSSKDCDDIKTCQQQSQQNIADTHGIDNDHHLIAHRTDNSSKVNKNEQPSSDFDSISKTTNADTIQEPESVQSSYSSIQIIEEDETHSPTATINSQKDEENDSQSIKSTIADNEELIHIDNNNDDNNHSMREKQMSSNSTTTTSSIPTTIASESSIVDSMVAHHLLTNGYHHPHRPTIEAINEQLSHAISTLAAAAASVSSTRSTASPTPIRSSSSSSPLSPNTVPSYHSNINFLIGNSLNNQNNHHHHRMANNNNNNHLHHSSNGLVVGDDVVTGNTASNTPTTTNSLTQPSTQPPLLLATGSPN
ncbi:ski-like protein [Dermatophagoides farinae]|uniref:Ski-like protein n=1 Tax=Dermatophagoides farinae TaxID=6954 RepID=A0A9D4NXN4_DERFA|nr:ski-like protein [Dermatophagoides farinae]